MLGLTKTKTEKEIIKKWEESVKNDAEIMLKAAIKRCNNKGITASYHIKHGNVANEILSFAKRKNISLIVIGGYGLHGIGKLKTLGLVSINRR